MVNNWTKGLKWLGFGVLVALFVYTAGFGATLYVRHQLNNQVSECRKQIASADDSSGGDGDLQAGVVALIGRLKISVLGKSACDPDSDKAYEDNSTSIGKTIKAIHEKQAQAQSLDTKTRLAALIIICLSALPLFWYFLLDRIREIARAVRGD